jgi:hypothetical protein
MVRYSDIDKKELVEFLERKLLYIFTIIVYLPKKGVAMMID